MPEASEGGVRSWIETFQTQTRLDLRPLWRLPQPDGDSGFAMDDPWGARFRPDWHARGLVIWPRGGRWLELQLRLACPPEWRARQRGDRLARLVLRWWADAVELRVDGALVHQGDLFDTACRWRLPDAWWEGQPLQLHLRLRSPLHDDGALITSQLEQEPLDPADPTGVLTATQAALAERRLAGDQRQALAAQLQQLDPLEPASGAALAPWLRTQAACRPSSGFHVLGHAHLDLAWLWPVADTWQAAERTFDSALGLMERHPQLHFAHSSPALYAWIEQHRPELFARLRQAMRQGRFEPINGPWVESDCVLISTASLLRQFELGQAYSRSRFPEWHHNLCWLPDSFGFAAGLPALAQATGVRWFCTHKLAWNATTPFPHRLFRWRHRCGAELLALSTAPIGTDGDPLAMEAYRQQWQAASGVDQALWLPGVGDHGGGPTAEMLQQLELWQQQPLAGPQGHGSLRGYLEPLEPHQGLGQLRLPQQPLQAAVVALLIRPAGGTAAMQLEIELITPHRQPCSQGLEGRQIIAQAAVPLRTGEGLLLPQLKLLQHLRRGAAAMVTHPRQPESLIHSAGGLPLLAVGLHGQRIAIGADGCGAESKEFRATAVAPAKQPVRE